MRKKNCFLFSLIYCFTGISLFAQSEVDSLKKVITVHTNDTTAISAYLNLYEALKFENQEEALTYLEQSKELSLKLDSERGILNALLAKAEYFETTGYQDSALVTYPKSQKSQ